MGRICNAAEQREKLVCCRRRIGFAAARERGTGMGNQGVRFLQTADLERERGQQGKPYLEFGRLAGMSAGVYLLEAGSTDHQSPHQQDEMYYVVRGRARMRAGDDDQPVKQGSIILVPAKVEHRFYDIEEAITLLVFFGPAEAE